MAIFQVITVLLKKNDFVLIRLKKLYFSKLGYHKKIIRTLQKDYGLVMLERNENALSAALTIED